MERKGQRVTFESKQETKTEQAHAASTNINKIVQRYKKTGLMPISSMQAMYGDFTSFDDYHAAQNQIINANNNFMALPSDIRKRFDNDPGQLLEFLNDEKNRKEAEEMGLIPRLVSIEPEKPIEGQPEALNANLEVK